MVKNGYWELRAVANRKMEIIVKKQSEPYEPNGQKKFGLFCIGASGGAQTRSPSLRRRLRYSVTPRKQNAQIA